MLLKDILQWLTENNYDFVFKGNETIDVLGFASLNDYKPDSITWVKKQENYEKLENHTTVTIAVVQEGIILDIPNQIISKNSKEVFFAILHHFWGSKKYKGGVCPGTYISPEVDIDSTVYVGYNCTIIGKIKIGAHTVIENNVSIIHNVTIGEDCLIHSGAVIGSDGFGLSFGKTGIPIKVEHFGGVKIGNRVEIGANTCVDRGTIEDTQINNDVKIDNLVHIGHNAILQNGAVVVAGAVICGSAELGENSYVAPGGIIRNQLQIGNNALVGLGAVVTKSVAENIVVAGMPAKEIRKIKPGDK